jgi:cytochrome b561
MTLLSTEARWGFIAKLFHWTMAVGLLGLCAFGFWMSDLPRGPVMFKAYALHKSCGITLLALALARLAWRAVDRRPAELPAPGWQKLAALGTHLALYALMLAVPLAGWAYNSAANFPLQWFGLVNLPALVPASPLLKEFFHEAHELGAIALLVLTAVHVAAAWKHHLLDKDNTLRRMLPGGGAVVLVAAGAMGLAAVTASAPTQAFPAVPASAAAEAAEVVARLALIAARAIKPGAAEADKPNAAVASKAPTTEWFLDTAQSKLTFTGTQQGETFTGHFKRFTPRIVFSPAALAVSQWTVTIDIRSNDSANQERDETMRTSEWFDVAHYPTATFTATRFRTGAGAGQYVADGELSIKGRKVRVPLPFRWTPAANGKSATLVSQVVLDRHAFELGTGDWADDAWVGRNVTVGVQLALVR